MNDKPKYIAHLNCSPWVEDGEWNIVVGQKNYHAFSGNDSDKFCDELDKILQSALDTGAIDSYYIQRHNHPAPVKHAE